MIATAAAQAAALAGIDPDAINFTAVLALVAAHVMADACRPHRGRRPTSANNPLGRLHTDILAHPTNRTGRNRTSGRTAAERRTRHTEEAAYTITITPSNPLKPDKVPEVKGSGQHTHRRYLTRSPLTRTHRPPPRDDRRPPSHQHHRHISTSASRRRPAAAGQPPQARPRSRRDHAASSRQAAARGWVTGRQRRP